MHTTTMPPKLSDQIQRRLHRLPIGRLLNYDKLHERLPRPLVPVLDEAFFRLRGRRYPAARPVPEVTIDLTVPATDALWNGRLSRVGGHEPGVCRFLADNMRDDDVVYDVGAHFGFYPALITAVARGAEVHGFEPERHQLRYWYWNAKRAQPRTPWRTIEKFVGAEDTDTMVSLDTYAATQARVPTLVKCDVEGYEIFVVAGAAGLVQGGKTAFLMEIHPRQIRELGSSYEAFIGQFPSEGWVFKVLDDIRDDGSFGWRDGADWEDDGTQPYLYAAPEAVAARHTFVAVEAG